MQKKQHFEFKNFFFIALGAAIYAFGFVYFYMPNKVAANGLAGLTLVFHALFKIDPTYTGYLINLPLVLLGAYLFGRRAMVYSLHGILSLYAFIWIFQRIPFSVDLHQDYLVVSLFAGIIGGLGGGIVFRYGGTIGGSDIVARVIEDKLGIPLNQALLGIDVIVMILSLTYINMPQMMYALIASFMYSQIVNLVENGGYTLRGMFIISDYHEQIAQQIMEELGRGVTYFHASGAYSHKEKQVLYVTLNPTDARQVKKIVEAVDPRAFVAISSVDEVISPEFIPSRSKYRKVQR